MTNDEMYKRIIVMTSIKTAKSFIKTYDISKSDLSKLCKKFNIFIDGKATKDDMIDRFLGETLGKKLKNKVINKYNIR
ncbi:MULTISPECIES: hypothetical protein [Clostridium]|uniref:Uncharacterized protein n=1 Tax=Clostridium frigoriphilum TaxID=443253 RepID=A0ABU7UPA2_9CLOT|nr:hypothetical protein [Clostridium sp. DSM 17811]MBU3100341.1 hypothetical protein [Clostridium sp. DSM 17811]